MAKQPSGQETWPGLVRIVLQNWQSWGWPVKLLVVSVCLAALVVLVLWIRSKLRTDKESRAPAFQPVINVNVGAGAGALGATPGPSTSVVGAATATIASALPTDSAVGSGAMSDQPSDKGHGASFNINAPGGQVAVGDNNVQNQTIVAARAREVSRTFQDSLAAALAPLPKFRFRIATGMDANAIRVGTVIREALTHAGWAITKNKQTLPGPARRGVAFLVKNGSDAMASQSMQVLMGWAVHVGLSDPKTVGWSTLPQDDTADVAIEIGEPL